MKVVGERVNTVNSSADRFVSCDDEQFQGLNPPDYKVYTSSLSWLTGQIKHAYIPEARKYCQINRFCDGFDLTSGLARCT